MTTALDMIRGRSVVVTKTNNSGGALAAGDVCVQDSAGDEYVTTTTSANSLLKVYVTADPIAAGAAGRFYAAGFCPFVNPSASMTRGRYVFTHSVAKQAAENATYGVGAFGYVTTSGATPSIWIFGNTQQAAISGAGTDTTAIHTNVSGEINALTNKASPVGADIVVIEDSAASFAKKKTALSGIGGLAFGTVKVSGQSDVVAATTSDNLTLAAGTNVTLTTNAGTKTVTITSSGGGGGGSPATNAAALVYAYQNFR